MSKKEGRGGEEEKRKKATFWQIKTFWKKKKRFLSRSILLEVVLEELAELL